MPAAKASPAQSGNTSSDFVRKLYRMLEEPEYSDIVRWGRDGDSFVVLEGEKFSTRVLPKHFKHGNFASFVRQLNKYDFHKVRRPDDGSQGYGPSAWEFKHPDFRIDAKDALDLIRRKAPSSKKAQQQRQQQQQVTQQTGEGDSSSQQQIKSLTDSLYTLQKQLEELSQTNKQLVSEIVGLQKTTGVQRQVHYELLHHLENNTRRTSQAAVSSVSSPATAVAGRAQSDELPAELRRAKELLVSVGPPPSTAADGSVDRSQPLYPSPADSSSSSAMFVSPDIAPGMAVMDGTVAMPRLNVYPSQSAGMEAFPSEQMQNMSYSVPQSGGLDGVTTGAGSDSTRVTTSPTTEKSEDWGPNKPHVFLVEDDSVCAKIGMKFIRSLGCTVALAKDGLEAVKLFDSKPVPHFDLVFMDIIMPRLDGVSATARIREWLPQAPIVAMTSNIRQEDVATYFQYGMTDVLAKPFIREGMQRMLRKHLPHLLSESTPPAPTTNGPYADVQAGAALNVDMPSDPSLANAHMAMKFEGAQMQSPSGQSGAWGSPGMASSGAMASHSPSTSPLGMGGCVGVNGGQLVMGQMGYGGYVVDERPEKRRRVGSGVMR